MKRKILLLFICLIAVSLLVFSGCSDHANDDSGDGGVFDCAAGKHNYTVENKCALCGTEWKFSNGLEFELSKDGKYYSVVGIGSCADTEIVIPYGYEGKFVSKISDVAFAVCESLTGVTIPNSVISIGTGAFMHCEELTNIVIPDSVTSIGNQAFQACYNLKSISLGNNITSIGAHAFLNTEYYNDKANWEKGVLYIGKYLIRAADSISGSYSVKDGTLCIGNEAFYFCDQLAIIRIPDSVTSIGSSAFYNCTGLTSVTIGSGITSIGDSVFEDCYKLVEVINRSSLAITKGSLSYGKIAYYALVVHNENVSYITHKDDYLFYAYEGKIYLIGYKEDDWVLTLPSDYNGQNYAIYKRAFYGCDNIYSVTIPNSVASFGECAFLDCTSLTSIKYRGTKEQWNTISKGSDWNYNTGNYTITYNYTGE